MPKVFTLALVMVAVLIVGWDSGIRRHDQPDRLYLELAQRAEFNSVLPLMADGIVVGSSVLVESKWLLTAKHVLNDMSGAQFSTRVDSLVISVARVTGHNSADLALLELTSPVSSVTPSPLYSGQEELNRELVSVGFGLGGEGDQTLGSVWSQGPEGMGIKRAGMNAIDSIEGGLIMQADFDHPSDARYNMTGSKEALMLEYLPMNGDSGGGLFGNVQGEWKLFGITLGAVSPPKDVDGVGNVGKSVAYGWIAQWHRVSMEVDWIQEVIND
jgi:hypothetical protein